MNNLENTDNYGANITEVVIPGYSLGTDRKYHMDHYLESNYGGISLARAVNSRYINEDQIQMNPDKLREEYFETGRDFRRAKRNLRHNRRQFEKARKYAGSDQKSAADRQFYHNLGNITTGVVSLPAIGLGVGAAGQILSNPIVQGIGAIDGLRNLFTGNGVQKTYNHFKNGEYGKGTLSLAGDVLDASPIFGLPRVIKTTKSGIESGLNAIDLIRLNYPIKKSTKLASELFATDLIKPKTIHIYHYGPDFRNSGGQFTLPRMYSGGNAGLHVSNTPLDDFHKRNPKKILYEGDLTIYPDRIADVKDMSSWVKGHMWSNPTIPLKAKKLIDKLKDWTPEEYYNTYGEYFNMPWENSFSNETRMNFFNNQLLNETILNAGYDIWSYNNDWELGRRIFDLNGNEIPRKSYTVFNPNSFVLSKTIPYEPKIHQELKIPNYFDLTNK